MREPRKKNKNPPRKIIEKENEHAQASIIPGITTFAEVDTQHQYLSNIAEKHQQIKNDRIKLLEKELEIQKEVKQAQKPKEVPLHPVVAQGK